MSEQLPCLNWKFGLVVDHLTEDVTHAPRAGVPAAAAWFSILPGLFPADCSLYFTVLANKDKNKNLDATDKLLTHQNFISLALLSVESLAALLRSKVPVVNAPFFL